MSHRLEKINKLLQQQISLLIHLELAHRVGIVCVNSVLASSDIKSAKVYISVFDKLQSKAVLNELQKKSTFFEKCLMKKLVLRSIPKLYFTLDESQDEIDRVEDLLSKINIKSRKNEA